MPVHPSAPPLAVLGPSLSVNEILARWPRAVEPLVAFGVDVCCGGALPLSTAASYAGVPTGELLAAIRAAIAAGGAR